jgi:hypothetical protein
MAFPEGAKVGRRTVTLPREAVDEILRLAAEPGFQYLYAKPYDSVASRIVDVRYEGAVYGVVIALDGSKAKVDSYWGSSQLQVLDAQANPEQLKALKARWKVGE